MQERIGLSTNLFNNPKNLLGMVQDYASKGFKYIEVEFDFDCLWLIEDTAEAKKMLMAVNEYGLENDLVFSVHAPYKSPKSDLSSPDKGIRGEAISIMLKSLRAAHRLGANIFTFHPGHTAEYTVVDVKEDIIIALAHSITSMKSLSDQLGIRLSLEYVANHHRGHSALEDHSYRQLSETLGIGLTLDIVHFTIYTPVPDTHSKPYWAKLDTLIPFVDNFHLCDMIVPNHIHLPLGVGDLDFDSVVKYICDSGYNGRFIVETPNIKHAGSEYVEAAMAYRDSL